MSVETILGGTVMMRIAPGLRWRVLRYHAPTGCVVLKRRDRPSREERVVWIILRDALLNGEAVLNG